MKATISLTMPVAILSQIGEAHGDRVKFFTLAAFERLGWKRWIKIKDQVYDTENPGQNPLANCKQIQKWRAEQHPSPIEAVIFWSPTPDKVEYLEKTMYFAPGTARTGKLIQWPL